MKNREFRELQVSSTQLAVIFFGILIIGVVIFLLGVSVGKKNAQASLKTSTLLAQKAPEQVRDRLVVPETKTAAPPANATSAAPTPVKKETQPPVKTEEKPPTADNPQAAPVRKPTASGAVATEVAPPKVEPTPAVKERPKTSPERPVTAAPKPSATVAPPKTETKVPAPAAAAPRKGLYYVQVGALATREEAAAISQRFKSQGYPVVVFDPQPTDKKPLFRVRIGGFASKAEADSTRARLAAGGRVDYFTVRD